MALIEIGTDDSLYIGEALGSMVVEMKKAIELEPRLAFIFEESMDKWKGVLDRFNDACYDAFTD